MIEYLHIRNLALISDAALEFSSGLNVLTGETGAGKSFVMKAIDFITGEKLGADMVRSGADKAQVEALFSLPDQDIVLRRELLAETGRSRFYINDVLSSRETVKELRPRLLLHTDQHGQQKIALPANQEEPILTRMNRPDLLDRREKLLADIRAIQSKKKALIERSAALSDKRELLELHLQDITKVNPRPGEEEELERQRAVIKESAHQYAQYERTLALVRGNDGGIGLDELLSRLDRELEKMSEKNPDLLPIRERISEACAALDELIPRLRRPPREEHTLNPDEIEARLYALAQLKRKLKRTMPEILDLRTELEENLSFLDACGLDIAQITRAEQHAVQTYSVLLEELNAAKAAAAEEYCTALEGELRGLGFSEAVRVIPDTVYTEPFPQCRELHIHLLWAPNPGQAPQPLDKIASGGELSRFLLAMVSLQSTDEDVTLIFDEVDAGVGGVTLNRVGERIERLAEKRQILLITHWPQLAARATRHFVVAKTVRDGQTFTRCARVDEQARQAELNRMSGIEE